MSTGSSFLRSGGFASMFHNSKAARMCFYALLLPGLATLRANAQSCTAPAAGSVNLCSPVTGPPISNASNPDLSVVASATAPSGQTISQTQAFIDGVGKTVQTGGSYSAMYNLLLGSHTVFVQAKTNTGTLINSPTVSFVIATGAYSAYTQTNYVARPTTPAVGTGAAPWYTGAGTVVIDGSFTGFSRQIARITDANTRTNQSFQTADEGNVTLWNTNSTLLLIANNTGAQFVVPFNPSTLVAGSLGARFASNSTFSYQSPTVLYVQGKITYTGGGAYTETAAPEIDRVTLDANGNVTGASKIFNFLTDSTHCLKQVLSTDYNPPTWASQFQISENETAFTLGFSKDGGQETGHVIANYVVGKGCRIMDTNPASGALPVDGDWGPTGLTTEMDHFFLHEAIQAKNSAYATAGANANSCVSGNCSNGNLGKYVWQTATLNFASCYEQTFPATGSCPGHAASGFLHYINGTYTTHLLSNQNQELIHELGIPTTNGGISQSGI